MKLLIPAVLLACIIGAFSSCVSSLPVQASDTGTDGTAAVRSVESGESLSDDSRLSRMSRCLDAGKSALAEGAYSEGIQEFASVLKCGSADDPSLGMRASVLYVEAENELEKIASSLIMRPLQDHSVPGVVLLIRMHGKLSPLQGMQIRFASGDDGATLIQNVQTAEDGSARGDAYAFEQLPEGSLVRAVPEAVVGDFTYRFSMPLLDFIYPPKEE